MKAAVVEKPNHLVIKEISDPVCSDEQVLIAIRTASICNGTDLHIIQGVHPPRSPYPCVLGHEGAGEVIEVGKKVKGFVPGDRVAIRERGNGCFAEMIASFPDNIILIPDWLDFELASLLEMLSAVYDAAAQAVKLGDNVVIVGQGATGLMMTQVVKVAGANRILVSEPVDFKRQLALSLSADTAINPETCSLIEAVQEFTNGKGADVVIETAGVSETLKILPQLIRQNGTIAQFGIYCGPASFRFDWLHFKAGQILATGYSGGYSKESHKHALELVINGQIKLKPLITHHFQLENLNDAFCRLAAGDQTIIKAMVDIS